MITKKQVLDAINAMPEEDFANVENVIEELILLDKVNKGLEDLKNGNVMNEEDLGYEVKKW